MAAVARNGIGPCIVANRADDIPTESSIGDGGCADAEDDAALEIAGATGSTSGYESQSPVIAVCHAVAGTQDATALQVKRIAANRAGAENGATTSDCDGPTAGLAHASVADLKGSIVHCRRTCVGIRADENLSSNAVFGEGEDAAASASVIAEDTAEGLAAGSNVHGKSAGSCRCVVVLDDTSTSCAAETTEGFALIVQAEDTGVGSSAVEGHHARVGDLVAVGKLDDVIACGGGSITDREISTNGIDTGCFGKDERAAGHAGDTGVGVGHSATEGLRVGEYFGDGDGAAR